MGDPQPPKTIKDKLIIAAIIAIAVPFWGLIKVVGWLCGEKKGLDDE